MGKIYPVLYGNQIAWIERMPMFFVATAPNDPDGHVNVSPKGGTVYQQWRLEEETDAQNHTASTLGAIRDNSLGQEDVHVGDLGSGSDYTPFIQHLGVPSTDIGSEGPYGVYHSAFDNYNWFVKFADPTFVYEQQQARGDVDQVVPAVDLEDDEVAAVHVAAG